VRKEPTLPPVATPTVYVSPVAPDGLAGGVEAIVDGAEAYGPGEVGVVVDDGLGLAPLEHAAAISRVAPITPRTRTKRALLLAIMASSTLLTQPRVVPLSGKTAGTFGYVAKRGPVLRRSRNSLGGVPSGTAGVTCG